MNRVLVLKKNSWKLLSQSTVQQGDLCHQIKHYSVIDVMQALNEPCFYVYILCSLELLVSAKTSLL